MNFTNFSPSPALQPYIKGYYIFESVSNVEFQDTVFPSGDMELIFNLGNGVWEAAPADNTFLKNPSVELWGQITKPLPIKSKGPHCMLGIRFHTHSAVYFFSDEPGIFNNRIYDLRDVMGEPAKNIHTQLLETTGNENRIALVEKFLLNAFARNKKKTLRIDTVASILHTLKKNAEEDTIRRIARMHHITPRYLQKLFYLHTGLSPKSFNKINRFQLSLRLIAKNSQPFTSIAYDCGYFDQSHFIRDFKSFTGVTPSAYLLNTSPVTQTILQ